MQREVFLAPRRERWTRLESLVQRAHSGSVKRLDGAEILELGRLYRATTSDLAIARRDFPDDAITRYLNALVSRAHPLVYRDRTMDIGRVGTFIRYGFPAAYRAAGPYIATAFAVFAIAALASALLVTFRPGTADLLMPGEAQSMRAILEQHHLWMKSNTANHSVAANFIMLNNIQVAFFALIGGMVFAVGTLFIMASNGIMVGATAALVAQYGLSRPFWAFVVPHGVIELSVIFTAGGAGMMIGDAILRPGLARRRDALPAAARHAVHLLAGCIPLLVLAGTIEGFFSPSGAPDILKFAVGGISGMVLYTYLLRSRPRTRRQVYTFGGLIEPAPR